MLTVRFECLAAVAARDEGALGETPGSTSRRGRPVIRRSVRSGDSPTFAQRALVGGQVVDPFNPVVRSTVDSGAVKSTLFPSVRVKAEDVQRVLQPFR